MKSIRFLFRQIFGTFSWDSPGWLKRGGWRWVGGFLIVFATLSYWHHNSKKGMVQARVTPPGSLRDSLIVDFVKKGKLVSVAPIEQFGKRVEAGIGLKPPMHGEWRWKGDSELVFTPAVDWPAGECFQVAMDPKLLDVPIKTYRHPFKTPPFNLEVFDLKLYQDPRGPDQLSIVGELHYNYPVDRESLEERVRLVMQHTGERVPLSIRNEEQKAYIHSGLIKLSKEAQFVNLRIEKGVGALKGLSATEEPILDKLLLPSAEEFLQIKAVEATIYGDNPEQRLEVETTVGIGVDELSNYLRVYVLPKKDKGWNKPGEVTPEVLALSQPVALKPIPDEHPFPTRHRFAFQAPTPSALYLHIAKGVQGAGSFTLATDYKAVVETPDYAKEIYFLHKGSLLAGEKQMTVAVRGVEEVKFSICRVLPEHLHHLMTQTYGDFQSPRFRHHSFGKEAVSDISTVMRSFQMAHPCDLKYTAIDLEHYLEGSSFGLFLLRAEGWKKEAPTGIEDERLVLITDMALIVKDNVDGSHEVFVQSITQGKPVEGAKVSILGKNSLSVITSETDAEGHVRFPSLADFKEDKEPVIYLVQKGEDTAFIPYQRRDRLLNDSRFDTGGIVPQPLNAYVFLDRGVARPGDLIHIGAVVKNHLVELPQEGMPLEIILTDPAGSKLFRQKMALPASHMIALDYQLPPQAQVGVYHVNLYAGQDTLLGYASIRVEEFLPDRLKMETQFEPDATWLKQEEQTAKIRLGNLFGQPAAHHTVKAKMILTPAKTLHFPQYAAYRFVDPLPEVDAKFAFTENFQDLTTDDKGEAFFKLSLDRFPKGAYQLSLEAAGFEAGGGRAISREISALVIPCPYLVGFRTEEDLTYLLEQTSARAHFIAIDPELKPLALGDMEVRLIALKTVSALVRKRDGTYRYQNEQTRSEVSQHPFDIPLEGKDFILPTAQAGDFVLEVWDQAGNLVSQLQYSVVGESVKPAMKQQALLVKLDKNEYRAGDLIEMQITAPFPGAGLVTIERDQVHAYKWFKSDSSTSVQKIEIPADFQGNGYVHVAFVRDWDSGEIYLNPLSYAITPFRISRENKALQVELEAPDFVRSGEALTIQYRTPEPAKILLFAVDEGILQVDGYATPDPLGYFFRKEALQVKTFQIADLILPKNVSSTGGDRVKKLAKLNFNPFKRKGEKPVIHWFGILDSDSNPKTVHYTVPDSFNGTLRVMAVAVSNDKVGSGEKKVRAQSYFVIQPQVPPFVAPGDSMEVVVGITNGLKEDASVTVALTASPELTVLGPVNRDLTLAPGQEALLSFQLKADGKLGEARLVFTAKQGEKLSQVLSTVTVRPPSLYQTHLIHGYEEGEKTLSLTRTLYPEQSLIEASASSNPLILARGLQKYIENIPYASTEQLICKVLTELILTKQTPSFQLLRERQLTGGGFSEWSNMTSVSPFSSLLAVEYMTEAKGKGHHVPDDLFNGAINYLENIAAEDIHTLDEAREQAYAIYLLTRNGFVTTNYLTNLMLSLKDKKWTVDLVSGYMGATHKLLQSNSQADLLISGCPDNAQSAVLKARHFPGSLNLLKLVDGLSEDQLSPRTAAYSLLALSLVTLTESEIEITPLQDGFSFHNPGLKPYFYQIIQSGFATNDPTIKKGIEVFKEYPQNVQIGDTIDVVIKARALTPLSRVAVVDLLPGGFELVLGSLKTPGCDYVEALEDRVVFYGEDFTTPVSWSYRLRAVNKGDFGVPPISAQAVDQPWLQARGMAGRIEVK